jgi:hypothetical protein
MVCSNRERTFASFPSIISTVVSVVIADAAFLGNCPTKKKGTFAGYSCVKAEYKIRVKMMVPNRGIQWGGHERMDFTLGSIDDGDGFL